MSRSTSEYERWLKSQLMEEDWLEGTSEELQDKLGIMFQSNPSAALEASIFGSRLTETYKRKSRFFQKEGIVWPGLTNYDPFLDSVTNEVQRNLLIESEIAQEDSRQSGIYDNIINQIEDMRREESYSVTKQIFEASIPTRLKKELRSLAITHVESLPEYREQLEETREGIIAATTLPQLRDEREEIKAIPDAVTRTTLQRQLHYKEEELGMKIKPSVQKKFFGTFPEKMAELIFKAQEVHPKKEIDEDWVSELSPSALKLQHFLPDEISLIKEHKGLPPPEEIRKIEYKQPRLGYEK